MWYTLFFTFRQKNAFIPWDFFFTMVLLRNKRDETYCSYSDPNVYVTISKTLWTFSVVVLGRHECLKCLIFVKYFQGKLLEHYILVQPENVWNVYKAGGDSIIAILDNRRHWRIYFHRTGIILSRKQAVQIVWRFNICYIHIPFLPILRKVNVI